MDPASLGLKCGLEIHQQLDTHKLFCEDPSDRSEGVVAEFRRRLRPTQSELGEVDAAVMEEAKRKLAFVYQATGNACLVEADEEPPHPCNEDALDTVLLAAMMLNATIVEEIHFMRKIVIDGSNTTGFQRSALVAVDGSFELDGKRYGVPTILLEEDAARKIEERDGDIVYRLDRLGVPLIEVATTPDITSPDDAAKVALRIGSLLRATRRVKRGIGTIREDVNVSVARGARTETKGVQDLRMMATFVEKEASRQTALADCTDELRKRGITAIDDGIVDLTDLVREAKSSVLRNAIAAGGTVLGVRLPGFRGLLRGKLGPELAAHARVAGVGGILHSDELPGHGITEEEVQRIAQRMAVEGHDGFALVADAETRGREALEEVVERARAALAGVTAETRDPRPDGTTVYSRPLPGRARMYPETDVPPIRVTRERLDRLRAILPEMPETRLKRIVTAYTIPRQQATQLLEDGLDGEFESIVKETGEAQVTANALTYQFSEIRREGLDVDALPLERLRELFRLYHRGAFAKEAIPQVLRHMVRESTDASAAVTALGLGTMRDADVDAVLDEIVAAHEAMIRERGEAALGPLMGVAMERLRGKVDGRVLNEKLRKRLAAR
ncbi:MAG: Glu-tRNA(Gln) amidotransferase subunit GatE [Methanobacteriota archaeon]|nr:MAG: Glu-tRNA(Gln) amidotransferase subunit GatE [Euryarchaeota archaeon]